MREKLFLLLFGLFVALGYSQAKKNVSGYVKEQNGEPLMNAIVYFQSSSEKTNQYPVVCDAYGKFVQNLPQGIYTYYVSYLGEKYEVTPNELNLQEDVILPLTKVQLKTKSIEEVKISAKKPFVSYKGNQAVYNLSANPAAVGGSVLDGIKLIPGLQQNEDGSLSVYGFNQLTVAINDQVSTMSSDEINSYLATLSVNDIEFVEIINNPGPQYGKNVVSVLNIKTKRKFQDSFSGFASADIVYRKLVSENARLRLNYNKSHTKNYFSYNLSDIRNKELLTTTFGADETKIDPRRIHWFQVGSEIGLSDAHTLGVRGTASFTDETLKLNQSTKNDLDRKLLALNLYHNYKKEGISWRNYLDYTYNVNQRQYAHQSLNNQLNYLYLSSDLDYQLNSDFLAYFGLRQTTSGFNTDSKINHVDYSYHEYNSSAYLSFRYYANGLNILGGTQVNRDERKSNRDVFSQLNQTIWSAQPYFNIGYSVSKNHYLKLALDTYYTRPLYRDLLPYESSSSSFLDRLGNPELKNSTRYNWSLAYTYRNAATFEIDFSNEKNPIVEYITKVNSHHLITKKNLDNSQYFRVVLGSPVPVVDYPNGFQWMTYTYLAYQHQKDRGIVNGLDYRQKFDAYYIQHKQSFTFPNQWYFDAKVTYYSPLYSGVYKTQNQWWIDFTLSKRVGDFKFSLTGYDLFNTNIAKGEIVGLDKVVRFEKNWYSPKLTFGVNYIFGNKKLSTAKEQSVISSEKRMDTSTEEGISIKSN